MVKIQFGWVLVLVALLCLPADTATTDRAAPDAIRPERVVQNAAGPRSSVLPNIVLVYADDLGLGHLGVYGQTKIKTPNIDALARRSLVFDNFYSNSPSCYGARIALFTGRHLGQNISMRSGFAPDTPDNPRYLARYMQSAGLRTAVFGKWGYGDCVDGHGARQVGFDEFVGYATHRAAHTYTLPPYPTTQGDLPIPDRLCAISGDTTAAYPLAEIPYTHDLFVRLALEFIDRNKDRPFFLYLPFTIPHAELYAPPDRLGENLLGQYFDASGNSLFPEQPWAGDATYRRPVPLPYATFAAMVSHLDRDIGRIVERLEALALANRTLVLITSDNGPHNAGGMRNPQFFDGAAGLRGIKWSLFEGGIRVPLIAYLPGRIAPGRVSEGSCAQEDILPTLLDFLGTARKSPMTGVSLLDVLDGRRSSCGHDRLYWQAKAPAFSGEAIRVGRWKAIRQGLGAASDQVSLFDLNSDPKETQDLAGQRPDLLLELKRRMDEARSDASGTPAGLYDAVPFFPRFSGTAPGS